MKVYFIDTESTLFGENEVHEEGCHRLPKKEDLEFIGSFASCHTAVKKAGEKYDAVTGCYFCSTQCS